VRLARLLCLIGRHRWYRSTIGPRRCIRCGKTKKPPRRPRLDDSNRWGGFSDYWPKR